MILVATQSGLLVCRQEARGWRVLRRTLPGQVVTSVIAREGVILAGTTDGIWRSDDLGHSFEPCNTGLSVRHVRWMAYHPERSDFQLAGSEPAAIFVSGDEGDSWSGCEEVEQLRLTHRWFLPYSPEAGCVRGFAFHGDRVYAAVEVGGLLRSDDDGRGWRLVGGSSGDPGLGRPPAGQLHADVHSVLVHSSSPDLAFAATGGGLYRTEDGGDSWQALYVAYCRAVWADPTDPGHLICGPADTVDRGGRIEASHDGGQTWQPLHSGLDAPWRSHMVERLTPIGDDMVAVLSNGQLYIAATSEWRWRSLLPEIGDATAVSEMAI